MYIENVNKFVYLGSCIVSNALISCCTSKASGTFVRLFARVWDNYNPTIRAKSTVYSVCVCSTLMYGSETWTLSTGELGEEN